MKLMPKRTRWPSMGGECTARPWPMRAALGHGASEVDASTRIALECAHARDRALPERSPRDGEDGRCDRCLRGRGEPGSGPDEDRPLLHVHPRLPALLRAHDV